MAEVPEDLLERAQRSTGEEITATIRRGLELVAAGRADDDLRASRGKARLRIDHERQREHR